MTKDILAKNVLNDRHQAPKKLIMRTLARAAMETDKALEEEDMYWLKVEIHTYRNNLAIYQFRTIHIYVSDTKLPTSNPTGRDRSPSSVQQGFWSRNDDESPRFSKLEQTSRGNRGNVQ